MDGGEVATVIVPIVVAVITAGLGYRAATRTAARNLQALKEEREAQERSEGRRVNLDEFGAITRELRQSITELKQERDAQDQKITRVLNRLGELEDERDHLESRIRSLTTWAYEVSHVLERPEIITVLQQYNISIQPPPVEDGIY